MRCHAININISFIKLLQLFKIEIENKNSLILC